MGRGLGRVLAWPGQAVLCVSQLYWTTDFERCVKEQARYFQRSGGGEKNAAATDGPVPHKGGPLVRYKEQLEGYIASIVTMIRGASLLFSFSIYIYIENKKVFMLLFSFFFRFLVVVCYC